MPELEQKAYQRQVAYKVRISDVLNGAFIKDELSAGYVKLKNNNVSRVNIIAALIFKSEQSQHSSAVIDDMSGKILLRSFDANAFSKFDVGDAVLVIGKVREFNSERYIMPEILKKIKNNVWVAVRGIELSRMPLTEIKAVEKAASENEGANAAENIYLLIKKLDLGDGVSVDDVIKTSNNDGVETIINRLLERGDIFEVKPGRLKVLE